MVFNPGNFLEMIADGTEAVTLIIERNDDRERVAIGHALRQPMTRSIASRAGVQVEGDQIVWNVSHAELNPASNGRDIREGDVIEVSATERYKVNVAMHATMRTRWELVCRAVIGVI